MLFSCKGEVKKGKIDYKVVEKASVNDSTQTSQKAIKWKSLLEECMHKPLFQDAFFLGLEDSIHIGSINNRLETNVNKRVSVSIFDTTINKNIGAIFNVDGQFNCYSTVDTVLKDDFVFEIRNALKTASEFAFIGDIVDTTHLNIKVANISENNLYLDNLITILQKSEDSSLLKYRKILSESGNALLARSVMVLGFSAEFLITRDLTQVELNQLKNESAFAVDNGNCRIRIMENGYLQVLVEKPYTIFGQFYSFDGL